MRAIYNYAIYKSALTKSFQNFYIFSTSMIIASLIKIDI